MGASIRLPAWTRPQTSAMYSFSTSRSANCRDSSWSAVAVFAPATPPPDHAARHAVRAARARPGGGARRELAADAAESVDVVQERVDDRATAVSCARVDHHAGRLVGDAEGSAFVEDGKRKVFRHRRRWLGLGQVDREALSGLDGHARAQLR